MAGTFTSTGSASNLTRTELEQLRKADFSAGGKALTVGDDGTVVGGTGVGSINAEPYFTGFSTPLSDIYTIDPPGNPGEYLNTTVKTSAASEVVQWYGPEVRTYGTCNVTATGAVTVVTSTTVAGAPATGDYLLLKKKVTNAGLNSDCVASITTVALPSLSVGTVNNPGNGNTALLDNSQVAELWDYTVIRPDVVQLFAVPGSGPLGREQTFLTVTKASTLHTATSPTLDQINADRVTDLVPPKFGATAAVDRADAVFGLPNTGGPRLSLDRLGYRVVLYKSNNTGTGPDLTAPIASLNPTIDGAIAANDQRMTVDYKAGIIRFSAAPAAGGDIKPSGGTTGVNPTTGRLQLYAVFFAVDQSATQGAAQSLYALRSDTIQKLNASVAKYDYVSDQWEIGSAPTGTNNFTVDAKGSTEDPFQTVKFGTRDTTDSPDSPFRGFVYRASTGSNNVWKMVRQDLDQSGLPESSRELTVADKTEITVGDGSCPSKSPGGDYNPTSGLVRGYKYSDNSLAYSMRAAAEGSLGGYGSVHLRRGLYRVQGSVHVPPGVVVEGEGPSTVVTSVFTTGHGLAPVFKFGPNTTWGVYDFNIDGFNLYPTSFDHTVSNSKIEGYDIVWNPTRRVWGIVQADVTANAVWFNEMDTSGGLALSGQGVDIKGGADLFFTQASANSTNHTPGHYPRISHNADKDIYVVVWVDTQTAGAVLGPIVKAQTVWQEGNTFLSRTVGGATVDTGVVPFQTHPSVSAESTSYGIVPWAATANITCWAYDAVLTRSVLKVLRYTAGTPSDSGSGVLEDVTETILPAQSVVSSTDTTYDGKEGSLYAYSVRKHPIVFSLQGTTTTTGWLTCTGISDWTALGVEVGSRFVLTGPAAFATSGQKTAISAQRGATGVVRGFGSGVDAPTNAALIQFDGQPLASNAYSTFNFAQPNVSVAVAPLCRVYAGTIHGSDPLVEVQIAGAPSTITSWHLDEREPDFVRIQRGGIGRALIAYQTFDTTGTLYRKQISNFDEGRDISRIDYSSNLKGESVVSVVGTPLHREHLATCYAVIELGLPNPSMVAPTPQGQTVTGTPTWTPGGTLFWERSISRDLSVINRSLGGRDLDLPFGNYYRNHNRLVQDISPRSIVIDHTQSLIPAVAWTGVDWTIASPAPAQTIKSDTGIYRFSGSHYLIDSSFYFGLGGVGSTSPDYLRATVAVGDLIYFPDYAVTSTVTGVYSEHVVILDGAPAGIADSTENLNWVLISGAGGVGTSGWAKNPGYRVSSDGQVIQSTSFITQASEQDDTDLSYNAKQEVLHRETVFGSLSPANPTPFGTSKVHYNDLVEGSSLMGDLGFKGVAVGEPKPYTYTTLGETPKIALAWGENFYACLDRYLSGSGGTYANKVNVYRQSFGPYNSGVSNLRVEGSSNSCSISRLTRKHVFTRHGAPITSNAWLATDGYRNVHVQVATNAIGMGFGNSSFEGPFTTFPNDRRSHNAYIEAVYTDAIGKDPQRVRLDSATTAYTPMKEYVNQSAKLTPFAGKSVWTGKEFLSVIGTETGLVIVAHGAGEGDQETPNNLTGDQEIAWDLNRSNHSIVGTAGLGILGGEMTSPKTQSLTTGYTNKDYPVLRDVAVYDVAWSGNTLAVFWSVGFIHSTGSPPAGAVAESGGSFYGVTLYTPGVDGISPIRDTGKVNPYSSINTSNYILEVSNAKASAIDPHIVWDGSNYFMTFTLAQALFCASMPEYGYASKLSLKYVRPYNKDDVSLASLGTVRSDGNIDTSLALHVGDSVCIQRIASSTGQFGDAAYANLNGTYSVTACNGTTINLGADLSVAAGSYIFGVVYSGAAAVRVDNNTWSDLSGQTPRPLSVNDSLYVATGPSVAVKSFSQEERTSPVRIYSLAYVGVDDTYSILFKDSSGDLRVGRIAKNGVRSKEVVVVASGSWSEPAAMGWNGSEYLVVYKSTNELSGKTLSKDLVAKTTVTVESDVRNLFGEDPNQKPGPGYGFYSGADTLPSLRQVSILWNPTLGRWVLTGSFSWLYEEGHTSYTFDLRYRQHNLLVSGGQPTGWAGQDLTVIPAYMESNAWQAGLRALSYSRTSITDAFTVLNNTGLTPLTAGLAGIATGPGTVDSTIAPEEYVSGLVVHNQGTYFVGVVATDEATVVSGGSTRYLRVRRTPLTFTNSNVLDVEALFLEGTGYPAIAPSASFTLEVSRYTPKTLINVLDPNGGSTIIVDTLPVDLSGMTNQTYPVSTDLYVLPREDVFVWTLGSTPAVEVLDADGVSLSNLTISGNVPTSERYLNLARPYLKSGGLAVGSPVDDEELVPANSIAIWGYRPHSVQVHPTPAHKVELLKLTGVNSKNR